MITASLERSSAGRWGGVSRERLEIGTEGSIPGGSVAGAELRLAWTGETPVPTRPSPHEQTHIMG